MNKNNNIPFLDVLIDNTTDIFIPTPQKKPTSENSPLLNYKSECPQRYKTAVIKNFIRRAKNISSSYHIFLKELRKIKQVLVNNEFPNHVVDTQIRLALANLNPRPNETDKKNLIPLYYCNQFHPNYKQDETAIKNIFKQNVTTTSDDHNLNLIIYYKKFKTANILIKNSPRKNKEISRTNVIYKFICPNKSCALNQSYIGKTQDTLSKRISNHLSNTSSSIRKHLSEHDPLLRGARDIVTSNTSILASDRHQGRLAVTEALYIKDMKPSLNRIAFELSQNVLRLFN